MEENTLIEIFTIYRKYLQKKALKQKFIETKVWKVLMAMGICTIVNMQDILESENLICVYSR
jgi:hypothetical protein